MLAEKMWKLFVVFTAATATTADRLGPQDRTDPTGLVESACQENFATFMAFPVAVDLGELHLERMAEQCDAGVVNAFNPDSDWEFSSSRSTTSRGLIEQTDMGESKDFSASEVFGRLPGSLRRMLPKDTFESQVRYIYEEEEGSRVLELSSVTTGSHWIFHSEDGENWIKQSPEAYSRGLEESQGLGGFLRVALFSLLAAGAAVIGVRSGFFRAAPVPAEDPRDDHEHDYEHRNRNR
ncbi:MAG: hypothetical protein V3V61_01540 [Gammaproteobacteria bacterium]